MVILPAPTFLLPSQAIAAPAPASAPEKEFFAFGSSLAHGDHASHLCRSLTCGKIFSGGAEMFVGTRDGEFIRPPGDDDDENNGDEARAQGGWAA